MQTPRYTTGEDKETRKLFEIYCNVCQVRFLYDSETDRVIDRVNDRCYVVCPCGNQCVIGIGGYKEKTQ